jgi:hypothetical protein
MGAKRAVRGRSRNFNDLLDDWRRAIDYDEQCGVINNKGLPCTRSLTCKAHAMRAKRDVQGRSRNYDDLLLDWQRANNPNFVEPVNRKPKEKERRSAEIAVEQVAGEKKSKFGVYAVEPMGMGPNPNPNMNMMPMIPPKPRGLDIRMVQQMLGLANKSVAEMRAQGVGEAYIAFVENNRAQLQRTVMERGIFRRQLHGNGSGKVSI